jgi:hypothetical protein
MSQAMEVFMNYAAAFEETYVDDDWSRLQPFFADTATYDVVGGPLACTISGSEALLQGMKKSIDGLDRRCDERIINVTSGPTLQAIPGAEEVHLDWTASYRRGEAPLVTFPGRSVVTVTDGRITAIRDEYRDEDMIPAIEWMAQYGQDLDGAYV